MSFTCISCKVLFTTPELQREHYKNDWHRYNLKRKIADLPPVTRDEFEARAAAYNETTSESDTKLCCQACHKVFSTNNSYLNHKTSKKHMENETKIKANPKRHKEPRIHPLPKPEIVEDQVDDDDGEDNEMVLDDDDDSDWESVGEEYDEEDSSIPPNYCLFCCLDNASLEENVKHMTEKHSFFIPDIEYLVDLKGLIIFLGHKVGNGFLCLWCDTKGKKFHSLSSVQQHMLDKGHCKLLHEGEALLSYSEFYDYSSSHQDVTDENQEDEIADFVLEPDGYELTLPSGAVIGHRSLALYYKQNLQPKQPGNRKSLANVMQHYRALGWTETSREVAVRKNRDLNYLSRLRKRYNLKLGMKQNKFQPHFRAQVMF